MPSYQTVKNTLKKLESRQQETDTKEYCGVIYMDEYEKLVIPTTGRSGRNNKVGFLVVPRPLTAVEWENESAARKGTKGLLAKKWAPQQNLWVPLGVGRSPSP